MDMNVPGYIIGRLYISIYTVRYTGKYDASAKGNYSRLLSILSKAPGKKTSENYQRVEITSRDMPNMKEHLSEPCSFGDFYIFHATN